VSLYNETDGVGIPPTPTIGGVGLLPDFRQMATIALKADSEAILLVGAEGRHLGQSAYLRDVLGREEGPPPPVDLTAEKAAGDFVRGLIRAGRVTACHDISDGGLMAAVAEMALAGGRGAMLSAPPDASRPGWLFGEDQGRYVVTCPDGSAAAVLESAASAAVFCRIVGVTGGPQVGVLGLFGLPLAKLREAHENWFPSYMNS
jgi:phosphoribosylformylglycinamidine synthase